MMRKLTTVLLLGAVVFLLGPRACNRLIEVGAALSPGRYFHDLHRGTSARFFIREAKDIHLVSYFVIAKNAAPLTQYTLALDFLSGNGAKREHRVVYLSVDNAPGQPTLPDGSTLARARLLRVSAPADATVLQVGSPDGRVLLQSSWLTARHPSREALLQRTGTPGLWFTIDELHQVRAQRVMSLSQLGETPSLKLPPEALLPSDAAPESTADTVAPLRVGPKRALVFNVVGPGELLVAVDRAGSFALDSLGVGGAVHAEFQSGHATLALPRGPSSILLRPLTNSTSAVQLTVHNLRPIGEPTLVPAERWASAWRLDTERTLRFPMYGAKATPGPVRVTARAQATPTHQSLVWRFVDVRGHKLLDGTVPLDELLDPFAAVERDGQSVDIGVATQVILVPPPGTAALETTAVGAVVEVDSLLEVGAEPLPLPPYDIALTAGLHWRDAATKAPRWLMLQPLASESDRRQLQVPLLHMPRIERRIGFGLDGPWVSVKPRGAVLQAQIAESPRRPAAADQGLSFLDTEQESTILVAATGKNARRVVLTCDLSDQLGGRLALLVDGREAASAPIATSTVRLEASAAAGAHRIGVRSARHGHCFVEGHAVAEAALVRRTVYLLPAKGSLAVEVTTQKRRALPVHYAIYAESVDAQSHATFEFQVDRGVALRRLGSPASVDEGETPADGAAAVAPIRMLNTHRLVARIADSSVPLAEELRAGKHRLTLRALSAGRYWVRFWIPGRPHVHEGAESWIITEALTPSAAGE